MFITGKIWLIGNVLVTATNFTFFFSDISCFIKLGANVNDVNKDGKTALHFAVEGKLAACVRELLENNASYNIEDSSRKTALDYAQEINDSEILKLFPYSQAKNPNI